MSIQSRCFSVHYGLMAFNYIVHQKEGYALLPCQLHVSKSDWMAMVKLSFLKTITEVTSTVLYGFVTCVATFLNKMGNFLFILSCCISCLILKCAFDDSMCFFFKQITISVIRFTNRISGKPFRWTFCVSLSKFVGKLWCTRVTDHPCV